MEIEKFKKELEFLGFKNEVSKNGLKSILKTPNLNCEISNENGDDNVWVSLHKKVNGYETGVCNYLSLDECIEYLKKYVLTITDSKDDIINLFKRFKGSSLDILRGEKSDYVIMDKLNKKLIGIINFTSDHTGYIAYEKELNLEDDDYTNQLSFEFFSLNDLEHLLKIILHLNDYYNNIINDLTFKLKLKKTEDEDPHDKFNLKEFGLNEPPVEKKKDPEQLSIKEIDKTLPDTSKKDLKELYDVFKELNTQIQSILDMYKNCL